MIEDFVDSLVKICRERLNIPFLHTVRGTVLSVDSDGSCTVSCWWGRVQHVVVAQPWPDCFILVQKGADVLVSWPKNSQDGAAAAGELPVIIGFYSGSFTSLQIGRDGARPAARRDDAVEVSVSDGLQIAKLATALLLTGAFVPTGSTPLPLPPNTPIVLTGRITAGSTKVNIGG